MQCSPLSTLSTKEQVHFCQTLSKVLPYFFMLIGRDFSILIRKLKVKGSGEKNSWFAVWKGKVTFIDRTVGKNTTLL